MIISEYNSGKPSRHIAVTAILFELFKTVTEYSFKQVLKDSGISYAGLYYCEKAISLIKNNIEKKLNITEIAVALKISSGYLSRIFMKNTGKSIIEYINKIKVEHAQILLESKKMTFKEVASHIGISDIKYFYHLFKKYTGITAKEYQNLKHYEEKF